MTKSPNLGKKSEPNSSHQQKSDSPGSPRSRRRIFLGVGGILLASIGGGLTYTGFFVQRQLVPLIEKELTNYLNRPVKVGQLERFSLGGARFAKSEIPATSTDPDWASVEAVEVTFDPLKLLTRLQLQLNVSLVRPDIYIEQARNGDWISTELDSPEEENEVGQEINIDLEAIQFTDAEVVLVARSEAGNLKTPVKALVSSGISRFLDDGERIKFDLAGQLVNGGKIKVDGEGFPETEDINLTFVGNRIEATDVGNLVPLPMDLKAGKIDADLEVKLRPKQPTALKGVASLQDVTARMPELPQSFAQTNGKLHFQGYKIGLDKVSALFGSIPGVANGLVDTLGDLAIEVQTEPIRLRQLIKALKLKDPPVPISGEIEAAIQVSGPLEKPELSFEAATTKPSRIDKVDFRAISASLELVDSNLSVKKFQAFPVIGGRLTGKGEIKLPQTEWHSAAETDKKTTEQGEFVFDLQARNVPGNAIARAYKTNLPVDIGLVSGQARFLGNLENLDTLRASGSAKFPLGGGTVTASKIELFSGRWQGNVRASDVQLSSLPLAESESFPAQLRQGSLNGVFSLSGNLDSLQPEAIRARGSANLKTAGGVVSANNLQLANGKFEAVVIPREVELSYFSTELRGKLAGKLNVAGNLANLSLPGIQATGELNFSEGISLIEGPLTATIGWNGQKLEIQRATAKGFTASGWVDLNAASLGTQSAIEQFKLDVTAKGVNLRTLPISLPKPLSELNYAGQVDFDGAIAGTAREPKIEGELALHNFRVERFVFDPVLGGTLKGLPEEGINLQLKGSSDRIELALTPDYQPISFSIQLDQMSASGSRQGERLLVEANKIQIGLLKDIALKQQVSLPEAVPPQLISGELSGNFFLNLNTYEFSGNNLAIANPRFGSLKGERLTGNLQYFGGRFILTKGQFQQGNSQYQLDGSLIPTEDGPQFQAQVEIARGQIQDILETLQYFELSDFARGFSAPTYSTAADLYKDPSENKQQTTNNKQQSLFSVGLPEASVLDQLRYFSEIKALLRIKRKRRQEASPLPELSALQGTFDGAIAVTGSPASGIDAEFNFQGKEWQWGPFNAEAVIAQGSFQDGIFTFEPVSIQSGDSSIAFAGSFGGKTQSGQLRLVEVPIAPIQEFVELPPVIGFGGLLNATVTVAGSWENPQARGELAVTNATINQTSIQSTHGSFSYSNARLDFHASSVLADHADPLTIAGNFPYQLPFASVKPDSDQLSLRVKVKDQGLALLNILTRGEVAWVDGQGEVKLDISGTFNQEKGTPSKLRAEGTAKVKNATIAAQVLPEAPLTEVNGKILFDFDQVQVESLEGNFSGGQVTVAGTLPLIQAIPQENPLAIALRDLAFNLKGLYQGGVRGEVRITGSALEPDIGGNLDLFKGKVLLGESAEDGGEIGNSSGGLAETIEFDRLKLNLGENIQIARLPILKFLATGSLTLNGTLNQPRPEGTIRLESGQVNLFSTQLRLAGGDENIARFLPNRGLDPYLDVRLVGSAFEETRNPTVGDPLSADVSDVPAANFGGLQSVRIEATVKGLASQLTNSVELKSNPARSKREIIALLGGSFVNTFGRGDTTLGLANLAGSAVSGSFQGAINEAFGLSEFRIFSRRIIINEKERTEGISNTKLGVGVEAGVDLTNDFSFSIQKIVNTDRSPHFGIRYRFNNNTVLRGSSNFSEESRAIIEYEQRF